MNTGENQMDADELATKVNEYLANSVNGDDKRFSILTKRRILDYTTKGLLKKPFKNGNKNYYTDEHFFQLIYLRELQSNAGVSDKTLQKAVTSTPLHQLDIEETNLKTKAQDIFNSFNKSSKTNSWQNTEVNKLGVIGKINEKAEDVSDRVLKNIGTEYFASSLSSSSGLRNNVSAINNSQVNIGTSKINNIQQQVIDMNSEMILEENQRNKQSIIINKLKNDFYNSQKMYSVVPGMTVMIDQNFEVDEEKAEKIRKFSEELVQAFKKITDGS